jgi:hypothetical protein
MSVLTADVTSGDLVGVPAAMATMKCSRQTLYQLIADGILSVRRVGAGHPKLLRTEVEKLAAASLRPARRTTTLEESRTCATSDHTTTSGPRAAG